MARDTCEGCGRTVTIAGGIANIWSFGEAGNAGTAIALELEDGSDYLLCYPCIAALPDEPTDADVARLARVDEETSRLESN
ncbi:hypothetical protein GWG54_14335 [Natronococcus sp. JC468]|uniref:DUF7561 family protein n=1 Tax=Natronococcus sp. JC468 TaxID=1961921 RepID=UPI00143CBDE6|nr:hypothetical protein [Natronococcus sp. JC468]NKE36979.1 hypothetical protein [Natronococcus sp. JC468]